MRFLTPEEEKAPDGCGPPAILGSVALLIRLAIVTGLRRGALLGLRWGDVILEGMRPRQRSNGPRTATRTFPPLTP